MPSVSEAQHNAMEAATRDSDPLRAAGILFITDAKKALFLKRGDGGDFPGYWCFPGGHAEAGESIEETAKRETVEELGVLPEGERAELSRRIAAHWVDGNDTPPASIDFTTFIQRTEEEFAPTLNGEHTGWAWADAANPPEPLHPGCRTALAMLTANELDIARMISVGELTSPQTFRSVTLFAIRITGTGAAYRRALEEFCWRDPADYLNPDFLALCGGLPVIFEHPAKGSLNSEEYADRNIGSIMFAYVQGDEVWGIAKIYDAAAAKMMKTEQLSTSPMVVVTNAKEFINLDDGSKLLIEGKPQHLDHIAICSQGVWDKGGDPAGVISDTIGASGMTEEEMKAKADAEAAAKAKADADDSKLDKILGLCDSIGKRMDAVESKLKADEESEEEKTKREAKEKADADEKEKEESEAKAKADAEGLKQRLDAMEGKIPANLTDSENAEMADAQMKADSLGTALGISVSRPVPGEKPLAYRRRVLKDFQKHCKPWADIDLARLDSDTLKIAETHIRADALAFANSPHSAEAGQLRYIERRSAAGHTIREPRGDIGVFTGQFRAPSRAMRLKTMSQIRGN